jgi:lipopolysaccharide/colanic/teichoic acid biosynthesis glycosyltransferase
MEASEETKATMTMTRPATDYAIAGRPSSESVAASPTFYVRHGKRLLDLSLGLVLLVIATPIILVAAALVVLTSGWPAFYGARRLGRDGRTFTKWKVRTMVRDADKALADWREANPDFDAEYIHTFKLSDDPRVLPVGRFLRRASIDELPQLWNVVRGDMSLVGPRPIVDDELQNYGELAARFLASRPGVTGVWQVVGRNSVVYPERAFLELSYARSITLAGDARLILRTAQAVLRFTGR